MKWGDVCNFFQTKYELKSLGNVMKSGWSQNFLLQLNMEAQKVPTYYKTQRIVDLITFDSTSK